MAFVKIKIQQTASHGDLQRWEDHMLEKAKCWNEFCLGIYGENELRAVHVHKDGNDDDLYLTTLCEDCIKNLSDDGPLVNENHLIVETNHN
jgi:hypothetical protein